MLVDFRIAVHASKPFRLAGWRAPARALGVGRARPHRRRRACASDEARTRTRRSSAVDRARALTARSLTGERQPSDLRDLVQRDDDRQHRDRSDPHAHERGQPVGAERDQPVHEQRVERVGADHAGGEHRADDQRRRRSPRRRRTRRAYAAIWLDVSKPNPNKQPDRDREQRARAFAQPARQQPRLRAGDARRRPSAACARSSRRRAAARRSRSRCRSVSISAPCAAKRVPSRPTSAEIASTMTVCPPAKNVPTNRLSSGVFTYALRVTLSIAARWSGSAPWRIPSTKTVNAPEPDHACASRGFAMLVPGERVARRSRAARAPRRAAPARRCLARRSPGRPSRRRPSR